MLMTQNYLSGCVWEETVKDDIPPSDNADYVDMPNSDDEDYDPANPDHDDYF